MTDTGLGQEMAGAKSGSTTIPSPTTDDWGWRGAFKCLAEVMWGDDRKWAQEIVSELGAMSADDGTKHAFSDDVCDGETLTLITSSIVHQTKCLNGFL